MSGRRGLRLCTEKRAKKKKKKSEEWRTSEQQGLTEITAQVTLTHRLHSEQVECVGGHVGDDGFL